MKNKTISKLTELGLGEKEAQLYYAAIKIGPATAQQLSLESGIKRATVYLCIESLIAKGLFHIEIVGKRKLFIPESPDKLEFLLEQKKQTLATLLPHLLQSYIHSTPTTNNIKMYQGLTRVKLLYDHILGSLKPGDEYLVISDQEKWHALDPQYFEAFIQKRSTLHLATRLILQDTVHARSSKLKEAEYVEKIKLLPHHIKMNTNMIILPNKVVILQIVEPLLAILIENQNVTDMNRALFNTIWELI